MEVLARERSWRKEESPGDRLTHIMAKGENALENGDFSGAHMLFSEIQSEAPDGRITDWPHFTRSDQDRDRQRYLFGEPHSPTRGDVYLGLCFANIGLGRVEEAEFYLSRSRYFLISPANFEDRKRACSLERGVEIEDYESLVTSSHTPWLDPATNAFLARTFENTVSVNDLDLVLRNFGLLEKLYGVGRRMRVGTQDNLLQYACEYAKKAQYELAVVFLKEYIKFELEYVHPAAGVLESWASHQMHEGDLSPAEWLLEAIQGLEPWYEYEMSEEERQSLKLDQRESMKSGYFFLTREAQKRNRRDLAQRYEERHKDLEREIERLRATTDLFGH